MISELLTRLGFGGAGPSDAPGRVLPFGWGMRGSLTGSKSNADRRVITDYRAPASISVGTLQAIETNNGRMQVAGPQTRIGSITPYNGRRFMGYADPGQRFVGSSLLLTAASGPALNRRQGLPATGPIAGQPLSPMSSLLLQAHGYDTTATGLIGGMT